jgi:hypothetical protein
MPLIALGGRRSGAIIALQNKCPEMIVNRRCHRLCEFFSIWRACF